MLFTLASLCRLDSFTVFSDYYSTRPSRAEMVTSTLGCSLNSVDLISSISVDLGRRDEGRGMGRVSCCGQVDDETRRSMPAYCCRIIF